MFKVKLKYQSTVHGGRHGDGGEGIELGAGLRRSQPVNTADPGLRKWKCHVLPRLSLILKKDCLFLLRLNQFVNSRTVSPFEGHGRQAACRTCECLLLRVMRSLVPLLLNSHNVSWFNPFRRMLEVISLRKRTTYMEKRKEREKLTLGSHPAKKKKKKADIFDDLLIRFYYLLII